MYVFYGILSIIIVNANNGKLGTEALDGDPYTCQGWKTWSAYEKVGCSQSQNKFLSPININTQDVKVDKERTALQMFPYEIPVDDYELVTHYNFVNKHENVETDQLEKTEISQVYILSVLPAQEERRDLLPFIEGLGYKDRLYFSNFKILVGKSELEPSLSSHQINGKRYPMEIVLEYRAKLLGHKQDRNHNDGFTHEAQIHILVNISKSDNPMFFPVVETVAKYRDTKEHNLKWLEKLKKAVNLLDELKKSRDKLLDIFLSFESTSGVSGLDSVESAEVTSPEMRAAQRNYMEARKAYAKKTREVKEIRRKIIDTVPFSSVFQPSWIFPNIGGYYYYESSESFPPCSRNDEESKYVFVMEEPMEISQSQLNVFYGLIVPTAGGGVEVGETFDNCFPALCPLNGRTVYFNPKNLQFMKDDHVHMISKLRRQLKDARVTDNASDNISPQFYIINCLAIYTSLVYART